VPTKTVKPTIILGIDPGTIVLGYGILEVQGQKMKLLSMGVVQLGKYDDILERLKIISQKVSGLIEQYEPTATAIEAPFFGKNVQSMLKLGRAQGVSIAASLLKDVPVFEYSPKKIKMSITGSGNASKEQVAAMLQRLCGFELQPKFLDATDGLAAAVCHHFQNRHTTSDTKKFTGWKDFVTNNPERKK
jgi:crossover junction endodeoxyribonuclease RuvC